MHAEREHVSIPLWASDQLDSPVPPHIEPPYFDPALDAWVLSRYEDVAAAFRSSLLDVDSKEPLSHDAEITLRRMREETLEALTPTQLRAWSDAIAPVIRECVENLQEGCAVDLLEQYLRPISLELAALVTAIDPADAARLRELAWPISASAAEPYEPELRAMAQKATPPLQACFHARTETLRDSGFVALSHTLPSLLANALYALLQHPKQWELLHAQPGLVEQGVEELLRYAGLTRFVRRRAAQDLTLGGVAIRQGDRLILRIVAANRDPARFAHANELDVCRREAGQLALGTGAHACVGASLIRIAAVAMIRPLVEEFAGAAITSAVEWHGGSGFRAPANLHVVLTRRPSPKASG
jgi:cytochrome P450